MLGERDGHRAYEVATRACRELITAARTVDDHEAVETLEAILVSLDRLAHGCERTEDCVVEHAAVESQWTDLESRLLRALGQQGPATRQQLAQRLPRDEGDVALALVRLSDRGDATVGAGLKWCLTETGRGEVRENGVRRYSLLSRPSCA